MNNNKKEIINVGIFGPGGAGKSSLAIRILHKEYSPDDYDPTIEDSYTTSMMIDGVYDMVYIFDIAGGTEIDSINLQNFDGFVIVYSVIERNDLTNAMEWYEKILKANKYKTGIPIIVVGNKIDLQKERKVSTEEGAKLAEEMGGAPFFEISAKTTANVEEAFHSIIKLCRVNSKIVQSERKENGCEIC